MEGGGVKTIPASIVSDYRTHGLLWCAQHYGCSYNAARTALLDLGVTLRPPGANTSRRVPLADYGAIRERAKREPYSRIANSYGVTRERIRQIDNLASAATIPCL